MAERPPTFYNPRNFKINIATSFFGELGETFKRDCRSYANGEIECVCLVRVPTSRTTVRIWVKAQKGE
jgi:hypothetical protein